MFEWLVQALEEMVVEMHQLMSVAVEQDSVQQAQMLARMCFAGIGKPWS